LGRLRPESWLCPAAGGVEKPTGLHRKPSGSVRRGEGALLGLFVRTQ